jgi:DNA-binding response OmpR family regulator
MVEADATVLVVDDDEAFRSYVKAALEDTRLRVVEASNGADSMEIALRERPAAILLDWRMPGQSGIATCRQIRAEPDLAGVRIAMVTGLDDDRDRTVARHSGADAFLVKDLDPDALAVAVRRLLAPDPAPAAE